MRQTTTLSTKGQVILPKAVRDARKWLPGTRLSVEETPEGVLLRAVPMRSLPPTTIEEVLGMLRYDGPPMTIEDMEEAIGEAVAEDWEQFERGRY
ncbi:MAG: AbrB/MazE/SpoVT family DNA-binding domain-containing protein [Gemmobacter sp.]